VLSESDPPLITAMYQDLFQISRPRRNNDLGRYFPEANNRVTQGCSRTPFAVPSQIDIVRIKVMIYSHRVVA
jgi:hypothetical protein